MQLADSGPGGLLQVQDMNDAGVISGTEAAPSQEINVSFWPTPSQRVDVATFYSHTSQYPGPLSGPAGYVVGAGASTDPQDMTSYAFGPR